MAKKRESLKPVKINKPAIDRGPIVEFCTTQLLLYWFADGKHPWEFRAAERIRRDISKRLTPSQRHDVCIAAQGLINICQPDEAPPFQLPAI